MVAETRTNRHIRTHTVRRTHQGRTGEWQYCCSSKRCHCSCCGSDMSLVLLIGGSPAIKSSNNIPSIAVVFETPPEPNTVRFTEHSQILSLKQRSKWQVSRNTDRVRGGATYLDQRMSWSRIHRFACCCRSRATEERTFLSTFRWCKLATLGWCCTRRRIHHSSAHLCPSNQPSALESMNIVFGILESLA